MRHLAAVLILAALVIGRADAATVDVFATGTVVFNGVQGAPLDSVGSGESVKVSFTVDSNNFVDGVPGDVRSYVIDESSFSLDFDTLSMGLANPFPGTPYFSLVDGFPVSDGFFVSSSTVSPGGVALAQDPVNLDLDLGYVGTTLDSLDILDAIGTYDFTGLTRFGFGLWQIFPDNVVMGIDFEQLTIVPEPASLALFAPLALLLFRRRR